MTSSEMQRLRDAWKVVSAVEREGKHCHGCDSRNARDGRCQLGSVSSADMPQDCPGYDEMTERSAA